MQYTRYDRPDKTKCLPTKCRNGLQQVFEYCIVTSVDDFDPNHPPLCSILKTLQTEAKVRNWFQRWSGAYEIGWNGHRHYFDELKYLSMNLFIKTFQEHYNKKAENGEISYYKKPNKLIHPIPFVWNTGWHCHKHSRTNCFHCFCSRTDTEYDVTVDGNMGKHLMDSLSNLNKLWPSYLKAVKEHVMYKYSNVKNNALGSIRYYFTHIYKPLPCRENENKESQKVLPRRGTRTRTPVQHFVP